MIYIPTENELNKQKSLIGEFVIRFEQICALIRLMILEVCYPNYTKLQNNNTETLLEGLTSDPLRKKLEALIYDNFPNDDEMLLLNKKISDKFNKIIPIRNSIAHGSMLMGWKNFKGELSADTFLLKHSKTTKKGIDRNSKIINIKSIEKLIKQINWIDIYYSTLYILIDRNKTKKDKEQYLNRLKKDIDKIGKIELDFDYKINK
ncbi:MAG: hypothetical protein IMY72_06135 [Bacteroidetes bacterium]|nr:hypothetical protein [Bacteroidota bacterium]